MNTLANSTTFSLFSNIYFMISLLLIVLLIVNYFYFKSKLKEQTLTFKLRLEEERNRAEKKSELLSDMSDNIYNLTKHLADPEEEKRQDITGDILTSTNNLRELLKIQANKIEIFHEKFVFSHILGDIAAYLSSNFEQRETEVIFEIDENVPHFLTGDVIHFGRIINNILEFSIVSTPKGKVVLSISSDQTVKNDIILNIKIQNDATEIAKGDINELFELQYDDTSHAYSRVGLYIAKKLILATGGTIDIQSSLSGGSVFTLQMPMQLNEESSLKEFSAFKESLRQKKILIYTSKPDTGKSLQQLFGYFYNHVVLATLEALDREYVKFSDFDFIVLDDLFFHTGNMKRLQMLKEKNHLAIIAFCSIFAPKEHEKNSLVDAYMQTPSNLGEIVELISRLEVEEGDEVTEALPQSEHLPQSDEVYEETPQALSVYREPIEETSNIDIDCFTYFKGARLLIVEDNLINQKIILSVLKKSGMDIEIANNGQEALDLLFIEAKSFDMILMDISMPVMDGLLATQHIRANSAYDMTPIVTFTAFAMGKEIEQMFEAGVNAYLTKPLNIKKLYTLFSLFIAPQNRTLSLTKEIEIEGLDIEAGIYNADESEVLYKETLKEFVVVYKDMVEKVPKWIKEKRYDRVKLACNEIERILNAIGAYEMQAMVNEMQKIFLYHNEEFLDKYILLYPQKLTALIETIEYYTSSS